MIAWKLASHFASLVVYVSISVFVISSNKFLPVYVPNELVKSR